MAHLTPRTNYTQLVDRLNRFPQGAPSSEHLFKILRILFRENEARLVAQLPIRPFTARQAARIWQLPEAEAYSILAGLSERALLVDIRTQETTEYVLPPPMAGFFEFALMRIRDDIDQKLLSELYEQYVSVEEDFIKALFLEGQTQFGRVLVQESAVPTEHSLHVLDYERATQIIETATHIGIGLCYCRHKKEHLGSACKAPMDICMTFNTVADSLIRHGHARAVDQTECRDLLQQAWDANLAQFGENVQQGVNFICNCCPCCCEAMLAHQRFGHLHPVHTSNFIARVDSSCSGCGRCLPTCPAKIISLETAEANGRGKKTAKIAEELCLGCGVCARNCQRHSLTMQPRPQRVITPVNSVHRTVLMAIERGKLQNLIFDNQVLWSHRALAAVLGAILKLPPVKRTLARKQVGSRYLERLCMKLGA